MLIADVAAALLCWARHDTAFIYPYMLYIIICCVELARCEQGLLSALPPAARCLRRLEMRGLT